MRPAAQRLILTVILPCGKAARTTIARMIYAASGCYIRKGERNVRFINEDERGGGARNGLVLASTRSAPRPRRRRRKAVEAMTIQAFPPASPATSRRQRNGRGPAERAYLSKCVENGGNVPVEQRAAAEDGVRVGELVQFPSGAR